MSIQAMNWVLEHCPPHVPPQPRLVLISIANHAGRTGENAYPSMDTMALETGLGSRQVRRWVKWLSDEGLVEIDPEGPKDDPRIRRDRMPNLYSLPGMRDGMSPVTPRDGCGPRGSTSTRRRPESRGSRASDPDQDAPVDDPIDDRSPTTPRDQPRGVTHGRHGVSPTVERPVTGDPQTVLNREEQTNPSSSSSAVTATAPATSGEEEAGGLDRRLVEVWLVVARLKLDLRTSKHPVVDQAGWLRTVADRTEAELFTFADQLLADHPTFTVDDLARHLVAVDGTAPLPTCPECDGQFMVPSTTGYVPCPRCNRAAGLDLRLDATDGGF